LAFLALNGLTASYGGKADVLSDVTLEFARGEVVGLIGPLRLRQVVAAACPGRPAQATRRQRHAGRPAHRLHQCRLAARSAGPLRHRLPAIQPVPEHDRAAQRRHCADPGEEARGTGGGGGGARLLAKVGLAEKFNAYPDELSGGQQQRVAIARALALHPDILLLDEVTSALDPELVGEVLDTIRALHADGMTMLVVSHEMSFIREVATTVVFMDQGRVVEVGPPAQIFDAPQSSRLRDFTARILRH
jgi:polar amino acid transport system ATP-binding protein